MATPGRFLHVMMEMDLKLTAVEYVVFDEADRYTVHVYCINPFSPNINTQILLTDCHTFILVLIVRIWF